MPKSTPRPRFSPAIGCGLAAFAAAIGLGALHLQLAAIPLAMFLLACLAAPFLPWLGFFLPVISKGNSQKPQVALTFDDGPDPATTPALLALLERYDLAATFFVIGWRAEKYPELIEAILARGHSIGNHSYHHGYLTLLRGAQALRIEIAHTQKALAPFGIRPLAFRPPVGILTPVLGRVMGQLGMYAVTFRFRSLDGGNRRLRHLSLSILRKVRPDDILVLHDLKPNRKRGTARWLAEVEQVLAGLGKKGLTVTALEKMIDRPVMLKTG